MNKVSLKTVINCIMMALGCLFLAVLVQHILFNALRSVSMSVFELVFQPFNPFGDRGFDLPWGIEQIVGGIAWLNIWIRETAVKVIVLNNGLFATVVIGPVLEEMFYRAPFWALGRYAGKWWWITAGIIMCLFFVLGHNIPLGKLISIFMVGMTGLWLIWKTERLWPAICCHAIYNLSATMVAMASSGAGGGWD